MTSSNGSKKVDIITLEPSMWQLFEFGVVERAKEKNKLWQKKIWNIRDHANNKHRRVDDRPYGASPGMVISSEPLELLWRQLTASYTQKPFLISMDPQGQRLNQTLIHQLKDLKHIAILCGRYEGIDERFIEKNVDLKISLGEYILSGGDLPAMLFLDSWLRIQPGVLGNEQSSDMDSFSDQLLDHAVYTRPRENTLGLVPEVLYSGHQENIRKWQKKNALGKTWLYFPQNLIGKKLNAEDINLLSEYMKAHHKKNKSGQ